MILQVAAIEVNQGKGAGAVGLALDSLFIAHSQQDEYEADRLSVKYVKAAGYDPNAMIKVLEKLQKDQERDVRTFSYWKTHPGIPKRISAVRKEISGQLNFRDYVNLTGEEIK